MHFCEICNYYAKTSNNLKTHQKTQKHLDIPLQYQADHVAGF